MKSGSSPANAENGVSESQISKNFPGSLPADTTPDDLAFPTHVRAFVAHIHLFYLWLRYFKVLPKTQYMYIDTIFCVKNELFSRHYAWYLSGHFNIVTNTAIIVNYCVWLTCNMITCAYLTCEIHLNKLLIGGWVMLFSANTLGWVSRIYAHVRGWVMHFWTTTFPNAPAHPPLYLLTGPLLTWLLLRQVLFLGCPWQPLLHIRHNHRMHKNKCDARLRGTGIGW